MRSFADSTGRNWELSVTVGSVRRVREATGVLLPSLFDDDCKPLADLSADFIKLVDVIWVLCEQQAATADVDAEQFAECLSGDSLGAAGEALVRSTADFFTSPEQRAALHNLLDKLTETGQAMVARATQIVDKVNPHQMAEKCMDFVLNGQESPVSTPTHEPLANSV